MMAKRKSSKKNQHSTKSIISQDLVVIHNPKSSFSEAIKSIRTNLQFSSIESSLKTILVTSPQPGDGKSFVSANLAAAFAQDGKRVLIIDADLRRGRQHHIFNVQNNPTSGYSNLIVQSKDTTTTSQIVQNFVAPTNINNVYILPTGPIPPNPLELLSSRNNAVALQTLRSYFEIIIIDCPPALGLSDAIVLTKHSDANIVTISESKTKYDQLQAVKASFEKANSKINGVILNKSKSTNSSYYADKYYLEEK